MAINGWTFALIALAGVGDPPAGPVWPTTPTATDPASNVPVFAHDLTGPPYDVIGEVRAGVRKATLFSPEVSERKIYRELWERARKLGADAVINARYGRSHVSALSWGQTNATGTAIRFRQPKD